MDKIRGLQEQLKRKEEECEKYKQTITEIKDYCNKYPQNSIGFKKYILQKNQWMWGGKINTEKLKQARDIIEEYCLQCNLRWDFTAQIVLNIINKTREDK